MEEPRRRFFVDCPVCRRQMVPRHWDDRVFEGDTGQQMISEIFHCAWCALRIERVLPVHLAVEIRMLHPERVVYLEKRAAS